ncbi:MAG: hypothetical protein IKR04_03190 [Clostridia bacterium]|nr:hypothetical protein [Clostridia bacterium]
MSKIRELLNDPNSVLVFDVDGVLAVMEWGEYNHYGEDDETWANSHGEGIFLYTESKVVAKMQKFLKDRNMDHVYVISKVFTDHELADKQQFLEKYYGIKRENVFAVRSNQDKVDVLNQIKQRYLELDDHHLIMIDDTTEVLTMVMDNTPFSTAHVSSFLDM